MRVLYLASWIDANGGAKKSFLIPKYDLGG
jgi:hypothetical protein